MSVCSCGADYTLYGMIMLVMSWDVTETKGGVWNIDILTWVGLLDLYNT